QVWLALRYGTPRRRRLPEELVALIMRLAGCTAPDPARTVVCTERIFLRCRTMQYISRVWFRSPALTAADVSRMAAMQLVTMSRDQGWATHAEEGPMSWFDFGVFTADTQEQEMGTERAKDRWQRSHYNRMAYGKTNFVKGDVIYFDKEGAPNIGAGECIVVRACAEHARWENRGKMGELRFWRWFEPVAGLVQTRLGKCEENGGCRYCVHV
ncbi:hypothetical protein K488DRAFT_43586, partial [Vararia minispora EC-137]